MRNVKHYGIDKLVPGRFGDGVNNDIEMLRSWQMELQWQMTRTVGKQWQMKSVEMFRGWHLLFGERIDEQQMRAMNSVLACDANLISQKRYLDMEKLHMKHYMQRQGMHASS